MIVMTETNMLGKLLYSSSIKNTAAIAHTPGTGLPWSVPFPRTELDNNAPWTNVYVINNSAETLKVFVPKLEYSHSEYIIYPGERLSISFKGGDPLIYGIDVENQGAVDVVIGTVVVNYNNKTTDIEGM